MKQGKIFFVLLISLTVILLASQVFAQDDASEYFEGKEIKIVCPHGGGGGFDTYSRLIGKYIENYISGSTVIVDNVTGAGGIIGRNKVYKSKPDGLTLGITGVPNMVFPELSGAEGVEFKTTEFTYLARITAEPRILAVSSKSEYDSISDLQKADQVLFAFSGVGSDDYYSALIMAEALDINMEPVTGYKGSHEANLAAVRGDVAGVQTSFGTLKPLIDEGDLNPILTITGERYENLKNVPTAVEVIESEKERNMIKAIIGTFAGDRVVFAPPGLDSSKTKYLREVLDKVFNDEEFLDKADNLGRSIEYLPGKELQSLVNDIAKGSRDIAPILKEIKTKN